MVGCCGREGESRMRRIEKTASSIDVGFMAN